MAATPQSAAVPVPIAVRRAALVAATGCLVLAGFEILLAAGAPLGRAAWSGAQEILSPELRVASGVAVGVWAVAGAVVLGRAGFWGARRSAQLRWPTWLLVGLLVVGGVMNLASDSPWERFGWAPFALLLAVLFSIVARSAGRGAATESPIAASPGVADEPARRVRSALSLLALPPVIFLAVIVAVGFAVGASVGGNDAAIAAAVARLVPEILLIAQVALLGLLFVALRRNRLTLRDLGWRGSTTDAAIGALVGAGIFGAYVTVLAPMHAWLQATVGDYVPAGSVLGSVGASLPAFFAANVLLAPFVEESLYRGFGLLRLAPPWSGRRALLVSSVLFGLLHWSGGVWYILLTGGVVGITLGGLTLRRGTLAAPFAAHLVLNVLEFLFVTVRG